MLNSLLTSGKFLTKTEQCHINGGVSDFCTDDRIGSNLGCDSIYTGRIELSSTSREPL